ncbi:MAG: tetratricopeptide repeat protein [Nitrospirae bacterium]|nr:tetratricopeptide repeat protein [Nitrospirota bacterium]
MISLIMGILVVYVQMLWHDFINLDDPLYVLGNYRVRGGLSLDNIIWAFTTTTGGNWHPLTWISHMIDVSIHGLSPGGHHLTSLLIHALNSVLLFFALERMALDRWRSAFVAAAFALHPMHVESVAWVAERKDVLSGLFWILAMIAYTSYVERPDTRRYIMVCALFVAGLMAKPMVVTLPIVLLLLDLWPLNRLQAIHSRDDRKRPGNRPKQIPLPSLIMEKLPLFIIAGVSSLITFYAQMGMGAVSSLGLVPLNLRIANAIVSYVRYAVKLCVPTGLSVIYQLEDNLPAWLTALCLLVLFVVSALAIVNIRRLPYILMGWLWYLTTLLPVIGLVQVGAQSMADRYTYIPSIGFFIIAAMCVPDSVLIKKSSIKNALITLSVLIILSYTVLAHRQVRYWHDGVSLFEHAERVTGGGYLVYGNLGAALLSSNRLEDAIASLKKAVELNPIMWDSYVNLGRALFRLNRMKEAAESFSKAIEIRPDSFSAYNGLGAVMFSAGKKQEALDLFRKAMSLNPDYEKTRHNLAAASDENTSLQVEP